MTAGQPAHFHLCCETRQRTAWAAVISCHEHPDTFSNFSRGWRLWIQNLSIFMMNVLTRRIQACADSERETRCGFQLKGAAFFGFARFVCKTNDCMRYLDSLSLPLGTHSCNRCLRHKSLNQTQSVVRLQPRVATSCEPEATACELRMVVLPVPPEVEPPVAELDVAVLRQRFETQIPKDLS